MSENNSEGFLEPLFSESLFSESDIEEFLKQHYHLHGKLIRLAGYCDLNFLLVMSDDSQVIIKIAAPEASTQELIMQNEAMAYLNKRKIAVPHCVKNLKGCELSSIASASGQTFLFRVLTYLPGDFYTDAKIDGNSEKLWLNLGQFIGEFDQKLLKFQHPAAYRYMEWDLAVGFGICQTRKHLLSEEHQILINDVLDVYQVKVLPLLNKLPKGIIHNDVNDHNLLVDQINQPNKIIGLIDFGDMLFSHMVNELAICCAYAIMGQVDPLMVIKRITKGYHQHRPLLAVEIEVLIHLVALRLCTTLCNSAQAIMQDPDNQYLLTSVKPALEALEKIQSINLFAAEIQILKACGLPTSTGKDALEIIRFREQHLARSLSLSYQQPLKLIRGEGAYLFDDSGRAYLDMVNNVCHVGHCQPRVVAAGQQQMAKLNTNTRYLHDNIIEFSEKLLATLPSELSVCMLVNSGSEANELAFRLAQCYSGSQQLIVVDGAYHGNTAACIKASSYKFDGPGGAGAESNIHKVALPDPYRGKYVGNNIETANAYAEDVGRAINHIQDHGKQVGGFICESLQGVAGQIIMPDGYLTSVYEKVRAAGGVCIADEVQVGFGRVGTHMWAFETQQVVPDIVTLGKPIGNGHPLAAVIMKKEIAEAFDTGMEYFNTFGGNPVSCAIGSAVLDVIQQQQLMKNALDVGRYMMDKLLLLQNDFELIGDVRGLGLFIGVELVEDRKSKQPASKEMSWLIEFFKQNSILMTSEGPFYNILKIKPPIVFSKKDADQFIRILRQGLTELLEQKKN